MTAAMPLAMFAEDLVARNADWLFPHWANTAGTWDMVVQSWIVEVDGRVVVIDPCVGNGRSLPHFALFDQLDTPFIDRFAATGIRPEQVDFVFCTHLHSDHCGWNTTLRDGRFVPTFPNARYLLAQKELDRWNPDVPGYRHVPENAGIFAASVQPVIAAGLVDVVGEAHQIAPSLRTEAAYGHTMGHSVVHLASADQAACFTGDVFHHPIELIHPEIDAGTCDDFAQTLVTRCRLIDQFVRAGTLIVPAHFVAPHVGHLREMDGRRIFVPFTT
jgi:glyoxylase-like metal-dependent hydrolase (beta-lactamase superfamily II)